MKIEHDEQGNPKLVIEPNRLYHILFTHDLGDHKESVNDETGDAHYVLECYGDAITILPDGVFVQDGDMNHFFMKHTILTIALPNYYMRTNGDLYAEPENDS